MAKPQFDSRYLMPKVMILPTTMLRGSWVNKFLRLRATLEDVQSHTTSQGSEHLIHPFLPSTGWKATRDSGLVTYLQGCIRIQPRRGLLDQKGPWGSGSGAVLAAGGGGLGGWGMGANADGQRQEWCEPDIWILS